MWITLWISMWISFRFGENAEKTGESGKVGELGQKMRGRVNKEKG